METGSSFTSGAVRLIGGSNGNSSTNDAWSAPTSSSPQLQIYVQSRSNLTINGDLELKAGTCGANAGENGVKPRVPVQLMYLWRAGEAGWSNNVQTGANGSNVQIWLSQGYLFLSGNALVEAGNGGSSLANGTPGAQSPPSLLVIPSLTCCYGTMAVSALFSQLFNADRHRRLGRDLSVCELNAEGAREHDPERRQLGLQRRRRHERPRLGADHTRTIVSPPAGPHHLPCREPGLGAGPTSGGRWR
jgi:hypothetical protein